METMIFISRHEPTPQQEKIANDAGFTIQHVGDVDAFDRVAIHEMLERYPAPAYCVVHPGLALVVRQKCPDAVIGVFENAMRSVEGGRPTFEPRTLHLY